MSVFWRPRGCKLWFDFATLSGDTVYDLSGQGNNGTRYGPTWKRGPLIGCLDFNGLIDYVEVPYAVETPNQITIETFLLARALFTISWSRATDGPQTLWAATPHGDGALYWRIWDDIHTYYDLDGVKTLSLNTLHLIHFIYDGEWMRSYIDNELDAERNIGSITIHASNFETIGCWQNYLHTRSALFDGLIALMRVYNRALTEAERKAHYLYLKSRMLGIERVGWFM